MKWTTYHHVKQNKPDSGRQISHIFSHTQNLDIKKWHGKKKGHYYRRGKGKAEVGGEIRENNKGNDHDQSKYNVHNIYKMS